MLLRNLRRCTRVGGTIPLVEVARGSRCRSTAVPDAEYVIVGAGSAGCVLANRISEAGRSVTLLEAGLSDGEWDALKIHMPAALVGPLC